MILMPSVRIDREFYDRVHVVSEILSALIGKNVSVALALRIAWECKDIEDSVIDLIYGWFKEEKMVE